MKTANETYPSIEDVWSELSESQKVNNAEAQRCNNRILRVIRHRFGRAYVRHLLAFLKDSEADGYMGFDHKWEISRNKGQYDCTTDEYGRKLRKYSVDQWSVGIEGDSWAGHIYIELKPNRYLKVPFSC